MTRPIFHNPCMLGTCVLALLLSLASPFRGFATEPGVTASWHLTSNNPSSEEPSSNTFDQRYTLTWDPRLSRTMYFNTSISYSRNQGGVTGTRQTLSPAGSFTIDNDLFIAEISGQATSSDYSSRSTQVNKSLDLLLASNWDRPYWPSIQLSSGGDWQGDTESPPTTDTDRRWSEVIVEWAAGDLETYYSYDIQSNDDKAMGTSNDTNKHLGRVDYGRSFFDRRLSMTVSGQMSRYTSLFSAELGSRDSVEIATSISQALAGVDPSPEAGTLPIRPALLDGNTNNVVFSINLHEVANLGIKADLQQVDTLYVHTGELTPVQLAATGSLGWDLYSSDDGLNWQKLLTNAPTRYEEDKYRYRISTGGVRSIYLKLVVTRWPPAQPIPVTEITAYSNQRGTGTGQSYAEDRTQDETKADLNLRYTPSATTSLSYSIDYNNTDLSNGNDSTRLFHSANASWLYREYLVPSFTFNDTSTVNSELADTSQRSYSLNIQSTILPTLETYLGLTRNENSENGSRLSTNHSLNLSVIADLYPNLDTRLELTNDWNKNEAGNSSNTFFSLLWSLNARLRPSLFVDLRLEHGSSGLDFGQIIDAPQSGGKITASVNWRPSELFSIQAGGTEGYGELGSGQTLYYLNTNCTLVRTAKTQFVLGYDFSTTEDDTVHNFNYNWSWNISNYLTFQSISTYIITEEDNSWLIKGSLTTRF